ACQMKLTELKTSPLLSDLRHHWILKFTLLMSDTASDVELTRILAVVEAGPVTVQLNVLEVLPELSRLDVTIVHVDPPSRLTSILTLSAVPRLCVHVMLCAEPIAQLTFVLGALTVMAGATIEKITLLISPFIDKPAGLTRTSAWVVRTVGIGPVYVPVVAVAAGTPEVIGVHVAPLSGLKSMSNACELPRVWVQVIVRNDPAAHVTAVFGAVTVMAKVIVKFELLMSDTASEADLTRISACAVDGPLTSHGYVPDIAEVVVNEPRPAQVIPPSRLTSMFTR